MAAKTSRVDGTPQSVRTHDQPTTTEPSEGDVTGVILELPRHSRRQLRIWLLAGNVIAWILIVVAIRAFFF